MRFLDLHPWEVSPSEAVRIQRDLAALVSREDRLGPLRTIAGADISFDRTHGHAGVIVYRFPELSEVERSSASAPLQFPYLPGLLAFREGPVLLQAFARLTIQPDLILFDGQGIAHPRRLGIASHLGLLLETPTIGCAKSRLLGHCDELGKERGSFSPLIDKGEVVGAVLRTRKGVRPIFVSPGHRVSIETAVKITMGCVDKFRIPKPTREADRFVKNLK